MGRGADWGIGMENTWDFKSTKYGPAADRSRQALTLGWSLPADHLSDDYTPLDKDADELFSMWLEKVDASGDIKIDWWIPELGELAPFQDTEGHDSFLTSTRGQRIRSTTHG